MRSWNSIPGLRPPGGPVALACAGIITSLLTLASARAVDNRSGAGYFPPAESAGGWRTNTDPEFVRSLGIDPAKLKEFGEYNLSVPNTNWQPYARYKGILVIKDGWIAGEWYNTPEAREFRTYLSSNGKSFAMICMGMLMEDSRQGRVRYRIQPESKVYRREWLPEGFPLSDPRKEQITFEQIFRHTSGLCPERTAGGEPVERGRYRWADYVEWVVGHDEKWPQTQPLYFSPGHPEEYPGSEVQGSRTYSYSSIAMNHLGLVIRNIYEMPAREFLWRRLLEPIGFSGIGFDQPPSEQLKWVTAGGLRMTPRDYARFAYFLLRDGRWGNRQLVPASWIRRFRLSSNYPNILSNSDGFFGSQYPKDMFRIAGSGLNWAYIIPSLNLIAIRTGRANNAQWDEVRGVFLKKLFASLLER